ncbi:RNA polymerase sigma factor [Streptomyces sp. NPDC001480]|uniref:RNA polymerase sigma factor n=1 Tax=Streptomyces sp. NPDC001480 TaxID=3364577 RepID=UPI0036AEF16C
MDERTAMFEDFVADTHAKLTRIAKVRVPAWTAEDLVAETFEVMYTKWREVLADPTPPFRYACGILRNKVVNSWRHTNREVLPSSADLLDLIEPQLEESAEQTAVRNIQIDTLTASIRSALTPREQQTLVLHYVDNLTTAEIADMLDINPATVRAQLKHSRQKLKRSMKHSTTLHDD